MRFKARKYFDGWWDISQNYRLGTLQNLTQKRGFKGTFLYAPPEVLIDNEYTEAGDVYSFAIIAFELITNEKPFKNCSFME